ncbi:putative bifunctional methylthioribulose-1-phosphate dehydratase/enolase-phosphatase E1 [Mucuna pruriens]|uniref:Bifunctional methylthioribulose-1-phosphate dehydratase/enolase-phosphatase E1 n=1 Tax=Mucuna pruriens TaxID=157652 RepID=A0A371FA62_MUCPR|nr:putative bifunctional methylthioribulose-1-phosphate dehydratase/enolase-phosphatase E1 [Mucuna pruriens]
MAASADGVASQAYLEGKAVKETKALITELCRHFYSLGWVSGTGGSITIKVHDDSIPIPHQLILMSPSGVQKERMEPQDMYVLSPTGSVLSAPSPKPYPHKPPKCSDCGPLFMKAYDMCDAGAVIHSHGIESCLVTMLNPLAKEFRMGIGKGTSQTLFLCRPNKLSLPCLITRSKILGFNGGKE